MPLIFSDGEVRAVQAWAEAIIHGGHWGDGDLEIPEESIILRKLANAGDGTVNLNEEEARLILTWSESSRGIHTMEEESAIEKLTSLIEDHSR